MATTATASATTLLGCLYNHIVLPARLPGGQDARLERIARDILERLMQATSTLVALPQNQFSRSYEFLRRSLQTCKVVNEGGRLDRTSLLIAFRTLQFNDALILYVAEQNTGLLIRRENDAEGDRVLFEAFEASPLSEHVLAANTLEWDFPGCAVSVSYTIFSNESFQSELSSFLERASTEPIKRFAPQSYKEKASISESRDTVDPGMITQILMPLLEVNGKRISPKILKKRVRDDVCWADGTEKPWRRCPFWLVLRVAVQRQLSTTLGGELGRLQYKFLICLMLAQFLKESLPILDLELLVFLKAKLCRRIAKLEADKDTVPVQVRAAYGDMFTLLGPQLLDTIKRATEYVEQAWANFKAKITRRVDRLPRHAATMRASWVDPPLFLSLPNSLPYLNEVLADARQQNLQHIAASHRLSDDFNPSNAVPEAITKYMKQYRDLSNKELEVENNFQGVPDSKEDCEARIFLLAKNITEYLDLVQSMYDGIPEQKSTMVLSVIEMWRSIDECATRLFPLMKDFNPGFPADILDVLQLSRGKDMKRMQVIRAYLQSRHAACKSSHMTIFEDPTKGCFAERYYNESPDSANLKALHERIEKGAERKRKEKEKDLQDKRAEYQDLTKAISEISCEYYINDFGVRKHDNRDCTKCDLERKREKFTIKAYEHPLPKNSFQTMAVLFELVCPKAFLEYREITWNLIGTLASPNQLPSYAAKVLLHNYSELKSYMSEAQGKRRICLASTKKSCLVTHWGNPHFPVLDKDVFLPNGMEFGYFDQKGETWLSRQYRRPTFAHHCELIVPRASPLASIMSSLDLNINSDGPSSYQVLAHQTKCPTGLSVHEFTGYLSLFSGKMRRWPQILTELGSTNLNFSSVATTLLICSLALQVGPASREKNHLGAVHRCFHDAPFCKRLLDQLSWRVEAISSNWRETNCMETIITLLLRLDSLGILTDQQELRLLEKIRKITFNWISALRLEVRNATDVEASERYSKYAVWAALLCRRTFTPYTDRLEMIAPAALQTFLECSIALQDNLGGNPAKLNGMIKNALVRDVKMVSRIALLLRTSLENHPNSLTMCLSNIWPNIRDDPTLKLSPLKFLPDGYWIETRIDSSVYKVQQIIHVHLLEGHFLVMGQPIGRLSPVYQECVTVQTLFGNQSLLTYPSHLPGMSYALKVNMNGHQIHLGLRSGKPFVRALYRGTMLELIPAAIFHSATNFDIPFSMINNCVHWLDLKTGIIEIRQHPHIWYSRPGNWTLNVNTRKAQRRTVTLVNPQSKVFQAITNIFRYFEYPQHITVFQPESRPLSVELRRLELSFTVNSRGWLESSQLRAEINDNQDAGTWYGLHSKIVLTEVVPVVCDNKTRFTTLPLFPVRSVIVPVGPLTYRRNGPHVDVQAENDGLYGIFTINSVLQRLDCQADPRLFYLKAQYHAYTSFALPDPLTGRTGTEEALHFLSSGICQPWSPLTDGQNRGLLWIARLTPRREYYPVHLKVMQKTLWDPNLTTNIQNDCFRIFIDAIHKKSADLATFNPKSCQLPQLDPAGDCHLNLRSQIRRQAYQRPNAGFLTGSRLGSNHIRIYPARHFQKPTAVRESVLEVVSLIRSWPSRLATTPDLAALFHGCPIIGGFRQGYKSVLLGDVLDLDCDANWGPLVKLCCGFRFKDQYQLMFLFALMAFGHSGAEGLELIRTLVAFAMLDTLKEIDCPTWPSYSNFRYGEVPDMSKLMALIQPHLVPYVGDDRSISEFRLAPNCWKKLRSREQAYLQNQTADGEKFLQFLLKQWPCPEPKIEDLPEPLLVNFAEAMEAIRPEWLRLFQNWELSGYISRTQEVLNAHHSDAHAHAEPFLFEVNEQEVFPSRVREVECPTLHNLLWKTYPSNSISETGNISTASDFDQHTNTNLRSNNSTKLCTTLPPPSPSDEAKEVQSMVASLLKSKMAVRRQYGQDLGQSLKAFQKLNITTQRKLPFVEAEQLILGIPQARLQLERELSQLRATFERGDSRVQWLQQGGLWPCVTPVTLLENLRSTSKHVFGKGMLEGVVTYALSITKLQRLLRMESAYRKRNEQRYLDEYENVGHSNWKPLHQPDWLLLEIDANLLIRSGQVDVAFATISPASESNSVLQMNMGQGKTSCIIPMAAAVLADGKNLLRVVVPKPLLLQTAQLLQSRLGGLLGRTILHIPFSRKTKTDMDLLKKFDTIHQNLRKSAGVLLALPEHMLSFKLSGQQQLSDGHIQEAKRMINIQNWISEASRDVIDEADSILAIRTQLIYPSGTQKTVDGHPQRWLVAEALLKQVYGYLWNLHNEFPHSLEVVQRFSGSLPFVFFLRRDVEDALLSRLVEDVYLGRVPILPVDTPKVDRVLIKQFISEAKVSSALAESIEGLFPDKPALKQVVYLLRGLIVHRILLMAMKKRWNVQYGLHPARDPMAVPFTAKGIPSEQAEWGHPDVAILFTCLAFYYDGLSLAQLRQALEHVLKSDDPSQAYDRFSQQSTLPDSLRDWNAINVDDEPQLKEIWEHLRARVAVIDYFLNNHVFPRYAKQFHMKLQASGWDIPLFSATNRGNSSNKTQAAQNGAALTTGFSGTNDWKRMLPLTISQNDLPRLSHTNAEVLAYLLEPRNRGFVLAADNRGRHLSERGLLLSIKAWRIRVLIDAGAQVLEMTNLDLVKAWLEVDTEAPAAVYFDDNNRACVYYRQGKMLPLLATTYADDLSECLVYLDEAHTRGTDLKLPLNARGALTLGLGQTKDHTVQAAMRLRQLGSTQSVMFFAPPEVHQSILDLREKRNGDTIDSYDVLCWLLEQTCSGIEQLQPLYHLQGMEFCRRTQAALDNSDFLLNTEQREAYLTSLRQIEQQSVAKLYGLSAKKKLVKALTSTSPQIAPFMRELESRRQAFQDSGQAVHGSALQEVEQEREVAYEVEAVREVQKPVHYTALKFPSIHRDILTFANTGRFVADSAGYEPAFDALGRTLLGKKFKVNNRATSGKLFVSMEFTRTVKFPGRPHDNFQESRPVNWIIWSKVCQAALIVIPEEAEHLLPLLRDNREAPTHIITYAAPVTRKMLHFSDLAYYSVPSLPADWQAPMRLKVELGIFAGRLYFEFSEYPALLAFLGVRHTAGHIEIGSDEDEELDDRIIPTNVDCPKVFARKPLTFLQEWLAIRRQGQNFDQTPMGFICQGKVLSESHHFFSGSESTAAVKKETGDAKAETSDRSDVIEDVEEDFCDEAQGDIVNPEEMEDFDESDLHTADNVIDIGDF